MAIGKSLGKREWEKFKESTSTAGQAGVVVVNPDGSNVASSISLSAGDIEVGSVELKDSAADVRAEISDANTARTTASHVLSVQHVDAAGNVLNVATGGAAAGATGPQVMGRYDSTKPTAVDDGDAVQILTDEYGRILHGAEPEKFQATITSADAQAATQVKAKTAAKKMYILFLTVSVGAAALEVQFQDDNGTPNVLIEEFFLAANGGFVFKFPPEAPLVVTTNQDLDVICSAAGDVSVFVSGYLAA
jgi:hypothetical protein